MGVNKHPSKLVLGVGVIAIIAACLFRFGPFSKAGSVKTDISSTLTEAINISDLSTAEFRYRGIAEVYTNEEKTKIQCRVCYNAIIKAGIDMKDVKVLDVDTSEKTVKLSLPKIDIKVTNIDEQSMATLPSDANVRIDTMLKCCEEDAETEARGSKELMDTARENLKATIEGLAFPILKPQGYTISWK